MKSLFALVLFFGAAFVGLAAAPLEIYWIDVEGGGATLIVTPAKESVLIDAGWPTGPSAERIHQAATGAGLSKIDYLIVTHFHIDHFGGAAPLAALMPIGTVYDNDIPNHDPDGDPDNSSFSAQIKPYREFKAERRLRMDAGHEIRLRQTDGDAKLSMFCLCARQQVSNPGKPSVAVERPEDHPLDTSDNANSIVMLLQFGPFRFFDGGDLTWNTEAKLALDSTSIPCGGVDVYQTDHHGVNLSNNPGLLAMLSPTVSVMNNGATKGGAAETLAALRARPSIQTMWQMHRDLRGGTEFNTDTNFIANLEEKCDGNFIKCSIAPSGASYTISIPATAVSKEYQTKKYAN